jgi:hypothetical protein
MNHVTSGCNRGKTIGDGEPEVIVYMDLEWNSWKALTYPFYPVWDRV